MAKLRITYAKSAIGYNKSQKETIRSLGLHKLNSVAVQEDNPVIRGMIFKVNHLVKVEALADEAAPAPVQVRSLRAVVPTDVAPSAPAPAPVVVQTSDDIEIVEGIGPKIAGVLRQEGIATFAQLAAADLETLRQILAQNRLAQIADPATWPQQAQLAAEGKFDELTQLQGTLRAGRAS